MPVERIPYHDRTHWLGLRTNDVTASVVAALAGLHPYTTALQIYHDKIGTDLKIGDSVAMRRGRLLEGAVAEAVREERPLWSINKANEYLRDPELRIGASPDFYVLDQAGRRGVLQAKTVASFEFSRSWTDEAPPAWIAIQNATEVMLDDADFGVIAALIVDGWHFHLRIYDVPRNEGAEKRIRDMVAKFWADTDNHVEPRADYTKDERLLPILFPTEKPGKIIDLRTDNEVLTLLDEREALAEQIKQQEIRKREIETDLKFKIGDAEAAVVRGWRMTLKTVNVKEHIRRASSSRRLVCARDREDA